MRFPPGFLVPCPMYNVLCQIVESVLLPKKSAFYFCLIAIMYKFALNLYNYSSQLLT